MLFKHPLKGKFTEELFRTSDDNLEFIIADVFLEHMDYHREKRLLRKMPEPLQWFYHTWNLEGEINNGGFDQFFLNATGAFVSETLDALKGFDVIPVYELLKEAYRTYNDKQLTEDDKEKQLQILDSKFYSCELDLISKRKAYMRSNTEAFYF